VKLRRIASLFLLVSTLFLLTTSLVLYVVPQGRVAYWTHWRLWGFTKTDWTNLHINLGLLMLVAAGLHVYYNWRAIVSYLTHRSRRSRILSGDFITALVLTAFVVVGTPLGLPPMRWVLNLNESVKDAASQRYGEPPYGHAELSTLETFARRMELDLSAVMERLSAAGFVVSSSQATLEDLAAANRVTPQALYNAMAPPSEKAEAPPGSRLQAQARRSWRISVPNTTWMSIGSSPCLLPRDSRSTRGRLCATSLRTKDCHQTKSTNEYV